MRRCIADTKVIGYLFMVSVQVRVVRAPDETTDLVRLSSGRWCRYRETDDTRGHKGTPRTIQQTNHCTPLSSALGQRLQARHAVALQCGMLWCETTRLYFSPEPPQAARNARNARKRNPRHGTRKVIVQKPRVFWQNPQIFW